MTVSLIKKSMGFLDSKMIANIFTPSNFASNFISREIGVIDYLHFKITKYIGKFAIQQQLEKMHI